MSAVRELTYYEMPEGGPDWEFVAELEETFKRHWGPVEASFGTVFSGDYAGCMFAVYDFPNWAAYANVQDNWATNPEWMAFLGKAAAKATSVVARQVMELV